MKRFIYTFMAVALFAVPMLFTSCDSCDDYYYDDYWYDRPVGHGYNGNWRDQGWFDNSDANPSDQRLEMARMLSNKWTGELYAWYIDDYNQEQCDSFSIDLDMKQVDSKAAAGICTQYSWPIINGRVSDDNSRQIKSYVWYIDNDMDVNITYSDNYKVNIPYDKLHLGDYNDGRGLVFDGTMVASNTEEWVFWTQVVNNANARAMTRAGNKKYTRIVVGGANN